MKKILLLLVLTSLLFTGCAKREQSAGKTDAPSVPQSSRQEPSAEETPDPKEEVKTPGLSEDDPLTIEELIRDPEPYLNAYIYVKGTFPQGIAGYDENGKAILYINGVDDINQGIRIIDFSPKDGDCLVLAYGTLVKQENGDLAISMEGYKIIE